MKNIILAVFATLLFLKLNAQIDTVTSYIDWDGNLTTTKTNNTKYKRKAYFKDKWFVNDYFVASGNLQMTGCYLDNEFKIEHDTFTYYYENGNVESRGNKSNGESVGVWHRWFEDGKMDCKYTYKENDIKKYVYYHYNGKVSAVVETQYDTLIVNARMWDSTGVQSENEFLIIPPTLYGYEDGWKRFFSENMTYPEDEEGKLMKAKVKFWIYIDRFGKVSWGNVEGFAHPYLALELERVINKMPSWTPAIIFNRPVDYKLPLLFNFNPDN